jgi:ubiquinol-cytochrome c reductase cytochrome c subunit
VLDRQARSRGRHRAARTGLLLAVPLLLTAVAVPLVGQASRRPAAAATAQEQEKPDGQFLYLRDCGVCHGAEGSGTPRGQSLKEVGPAEVHYAVSTGRMPITSPGDERRRRPVMYSHEEIEALVDHMRPFIAPKPDIPHVDVKEGKLHEGAKLFSAECASCHQWGGQGGALLGREAPALDRSTPTQIAEAIRTGPVSMPEYGEEVIDEEKLNSIVKYVLYLREPEDRGGDPTWHLGPFSEGLVAWVLGMGLIVLALLWIGDRE